MTLNESMIYFISQLNNLARCSQHFASLTDIREIYLEEGVEAIDGHLVYDETKPIGKTDNGTKVYRAVQYLHFTETEMPVVDQYLDEDPYIQQAYVCVSDAAIYCTVETKNLYIDIYDGAWTAIQKEDNR